MILSKEDNLYADSNDSVARDNLLISEREEKNVVTVEIKYLRY